MASFIYIRGKDPFVPKIATGGTIHDLTIGGQLYRFHEFKTNGTFEIVSGVFDDLEYLIVAGGGGGYMVCGGAGAGGLLHNFGNPINKSIGSYDVLVGEGGTYRTGTPTGQGGDSSIFNIISLGGGTAASNIVGGSGRGGGRISLGNATTTQGTNGTPGQGHKGGSGYKSSFNLITAGGGGGGAGGAGGNAGNERPGTPGPGLNLSQYVGTSFGQNGWFAAGGQSAGINISDYWYRGPNGPHMSSPGSSFVRRIPSRTYPIDTATAEGRDGIVIIRYKI